MDTVRFLTIIITVFLISCEKDNIIRKSDITFGDYTNMIVTNHDTILVGGYHDTQKLDIDIDNDNVKDIRLISEIWGSPGLGQNPCSKIWSLHDKMLINGYFTNDTSFLNRSTRIFSGPNNTTEIYEYYNYTCHQIDESDSILHIYYDMFKLLPMDRGNPLNMNDSFKADSITLIDDWYGNPYTQEYYGTDTVLFKVNTFYNDCNVFPLDVIKYIGFKLEDEGESRLGWIKLSVIDKFKVILLETAIQA